MLRTLNQWSSLDGCCFSLLQLQEAGWAPAPASSETPPRPIFLSPRLLLGLLVIPQGLHSIESYALRDLYSAGPDSSTLLFWVEAASPGARESSTCTQREWPGFYHPKPSVSGRQGPHVLPELQQAYRAGVGNAVGSCFFLPDLGLEND